MRDLASSILRSGLPFSSFPLVNDQRKWVSLSERNWTYSVSMKWPTGHICRCTFAFIHFPGCLVFVRHVAAARRESEFRTEPGSRYPADLELKSLDGLDSSEHPLDLNDGFPA